MPEEETIKFVTLYLEGITHEWWHHDMFTLGHDWVSSYAKFMERLIDLFDGMDLKLNFKEFAQLKETRLV